MGGEESNREKVDGGLGMNRTTTCTCITYSVHVIGIQLAFATQQTLQVLYMLCCKEGLEVKLQQ